MRSLLFYYCLILIIILTLGAAFSAQKGPIIPLLLILPITVYFLSILLVKINRLRLLFPYQKPLITVTLYYGFIVAAVMTISGFIGAKNIPQLLSAVFLLPLVLYLTLRVLPKKRLAVTVPAVVKTQKLKQSKKAAAATPAKSDLAPVELPRVDVDRRQFLRLIGSAGLTIFIFSIFTKKAQAAFFGSVPGPGTIALKDTTGVQIDPSQNHPTDGYKISQIDDSSPAYYGFLNKSGAWFIMKEDSSGNYRYTKGASSFSTNWTNRASLSYDYFDTVF